MANVMTIADAIAYYTELKAEASKVISLINNTVDLNSFGEYKSSRWFNKSGIQFIREYLVREHSEEKLIDKFAEIEEATHKSITHIEDIIEGLQQISAASDLITAILYATHSGKYKKVNSAIRAVFIPISCDESFHSTRWEDLLSWRLNNLGFILLEIMKSSP